MSNIAIHMGLVFKKRFNHFIYKVSRSNNVNKRICCVDLCEALLLSSYIVESGNNTEEDSLKNSLIEAEEETNETQNVLFHDSGIILFLNIIIKRGRDSSPSIRSRALAVSVYDLVRYIVFEPYSGLYVQRRIRDHKRRSGSIIKEWINSRYRMQWDCLLNRLSEYYLHIMQRNVVRFQIHLSSKCSASLPFTGSLCLYFLP